MSRLLAKNVYVLLIISRYADMIMKEIGWRAKYVGYVVEVLRTLGHWNVCTCNIVIFVCMFDSAL